MIATRFSLAVTVTSSLFVLGKSASESGCAGCVLGFCWGCADDGVMGFCFGCEESHYAQYGKAKEEKAIQIQREYRNRSARVGNVSSRSIPSDPGRTYQNKFGPKGGQDAGFQKFMPPAEQKAYHANSNDQGDVSRSSPGFGAQGANSPATRGSHQAPYEGKYATQRGQTSRVSNDPGRAYQNKFGPKGGQDAGFQKFMPPTEQKSYHAYSNDKGQNAQASPSVNRSLPGYAAQGAVHGGNDATQYTQAGKSTDVKRARHAATQIAKEYRNSSTRVGNVSSKSLSQDPDRAYQNKYGPQGGQDAGFQKFMPQTEQKEQKEQQKYSGYGTQGADSQAAGGGYQTGYGGNDASQYGRGSYQAQYGGNYGSPYGLPFQLSQESHEDVGQRGSLAAISLPVAAAAALIMTGWASVAAFSRSRVVAHEDDPDEVAARYLLLA